MYKNINVENVKQCVKKVNTYMQNYKVTTISGTVVLRLSLLHNFIQLSLNSGSAQVQTLFATCWRFAMLRISGNGPGWK